MSLTKLCEILRAGEVKLTVVDVDSHGLGKETMASINLVADISADMLQASQLESSDNLASGMSLEKSMGSSLGLNAGFGSSSGRFASATHLGLGETHGSSKDSARPLLSLGMCTPMSSYSPNRYEIDAGEFERADTETEWEFTLKLQQHEKHGKGPSAVSPIMPVANYNISLASPTPWLRLSRSKRLSKKR